MTMQFFYETLLPCRICGGDIDTCCHAYETRRKYENDICQCDECAGTPGVKIHLSSCAVHREPAEPNGPCDCRSN